MFLKVSGWGPKGVSIQLELKFESVSYSWIEKYLWLVQLELHIISIPPGMWLNEMRKIKASDRQHDNSPLIRQLTDHQHATDLNPSYFFNRLFSLFSQFGPSSHGIQLHLEYSHTLLTWMHSCNPSPSFSTIHSPFFRVRWETWLGLAPTYHLFMSFYCPQEYIQITIVSSFASTYELEIISMPIIHPHPKSYYSSIQYSSYTLQTKTMHNIIVLENLPGRSHIKVWYTV